jgi:hypothetical protein
MEKEDYRALGLFSIILLDLVGYSGGGFFLGYYASRHWGWPVWLAGVTAFLGLAVAFYQIYRIFRKSQRPAA